MSGRIIPRAKSPINGYWLENLLDQFPQLPIFNKLKKSQVLGGLAYFRSQFDITFCYFSFLHYFPQFVNMKTAFFPSLLCRAKAQDCGFEDYYCDCLAGLVDIQKL